LSQRQGGITPELLVRRYAAAVRAVCLANSRNGHDADDIAQEALLKALSNLHTLKDYRAAGKWLARIARNACTDHYRRQRVTASIDSDIPARPHADDSTRALRTAVSSLPARYGEVITLYYMDGRNCDAIAALLNITPAAVRKRLARARLMLHQALREDAI
jgi:RNA polymerase sigma-70 factor (ECF subfamily)